MGARDLGSATAVVTGGGRGIGRAVADSLAARSVKVGLLARGRDALEAAAEELADAHGTEALAVPCDVTDAEAVEAAVDLVAERLGEPTILVHCAGTLLDRPLLEAEPGELLDVVATNLGAAMFVCRAVGRRMVGNELPGKVVLIGSAFARKGVSGYSAYSASKAGIEGLTRALAVEWARYGIQVNCVVPGHVQTAMTAEAFADEATRGAVLRTIPARRLGDPADIAAMVIALVGPEAGFVTGASLVVDGGFSVR